MALTRNITQVPIVNDVWRYTDEDGNDAWKVEKIEHGVAQLVKLTGQAAGAYRRMYRVSDMQRSGWDYVSGSNAAKVFFNCPSCGGANPILVGDYMCVKCREDF